MTAQEVWRVQLSQWLVKRACDTGCIGLAAQVDQTTCLMLYPDNYQEWCVACLMTAAAEAIAPPTGGQS
jgi:hypothetical protein